MEKLYIDELVRLINIPTVFDENAVENGPFGQAVKEGLEEVLHFGETLGFSTKNYNGYAGEMTMGNGDYIIGILCHVDVVEAGPGWTREPFRGELSDGRLYGRGSSDDKGPLVAAMAAVVKLKEAGKIPPEVAVRIIIGTNEEEAWGGINYYVKKAARLPDVSFVPDAEFPLIFCEKGLLDLDLEWKSEQNNQAQILLNRISGGGGRNIVAPGCEAVLRCASGAAEAETLSEKLEHIIRAQGYDAKTAVNGSEITVTVHGSAAHAMTPEKGVNAISQMIALLYGATGDSCSHSRFFRDYMNVIGLDYNGSCGGFAFEDKESGKLTFNVGSLELTEEGALQLKTNVRYPASLKYDMIVNCIADGLEKGNFSVDIVDYLPPISYRMDSPLVETLLEAYQEVTGDRESVPISMGGATYARAIPNAVSYGPLFPGEEELAHGPDEFIAIESLTAATDVYVRALEKLIEKRL